MRRPRLERCLPLPPLRVSVSSSRAGVLDGHSHLGYSWGPAPFLNPGSQAAEDSMLWPEPVLRASSSFPATGLPKSDSSGKCQSCPDPMPAGPTGANKPKRSPRPQMGRARPRSGQSKSQAKAQATGTASGRLPRLCVPRAFHLSLSLWAQDKIHFP